MQLHSANLTEAKGQQKLELAETECVKKYLASMTSEDASPALDVEDDFS